MPTLEDECHIKRAVMRIVPISASKARTATPVAVTATAASTPATSSDRSPVPAPLLAEPLFRDGGLDFEDGVDAFGGQVESGFMREERRRIEVVEDGDVDLAGTAAMYLPWVALA